MLASFAPDGRRRWQVENEGSAYEPPVFAPDGPILWAEGDLVVTREPDSAPARIVAGADSAVIVGGSPTRKRWDLYHKWQDLSADTFVACLGPDGVDRWIWYAPGPLSQLPVVLSRERRR